MGLKESASAHIDAPPRAVFAAVTDLVRLPDWNQGITEIVELPEGLARGSMWKVRVRALGQSWVSKSVVSILDSDGGVFEYRSQSDDGNPSYADWTWRIEPDGAGSNVTVTADINPRTFWRKRLLAKIRRVGLRKEIQESLEALAAFVAS